MTNDLLAKASFLGLVGVLYYLISYFGPIVKKNFIDKWENLLKKYGLLNAYLVFHKIFKVLLYLILALMVLGIVWFFVWGSLLK
jgi:hypothetical protein